MQIHKFRKILIKLITDSSDSNHPLKFFVIVILKTKERYRRRQQSKQTHNLLVSFTVFVHES